MRGASNGNARPIVHRSGRGDAADRACARDGNCAARGAADLARNEPALPREAGTHERAMASTTMLKCRQSFARQARPEPTPSGPVLGVSETSGQSALEGGLAIAVRMTRSKLRKAADGAYTQAAAGRPRAGGEKHARSPMTLKGNDTPRGALQRPPTACGAPATAIRGRFASSRSSRAVARPKWGGRCGIGSLRLFGRRSQVGFSGGMASHRWEHLYRMTPRVPVRCAIDRTPRGPAIRARANVCGVRRRWCRCRSDRSAPAAGPWKRSDQRDAQSRAAWDLSGSDPENTPASESWPARAQSRRPAARSSARVRRACMRRRRSPNAK